MTFSVVMVITDSTAHLVSLTMDSVVSQSYDSFEIVVIDGQTQEHSLEIFDAYKARISRIYSALDLNLYSMMNKGISLAKGQYIHFLMPGEFYISRHAFSFMAEFIGQHQRPDLIYCGGIIRHSLSPPQIILHKTTLQDLKGGKLSASLQSYWFLREALISVGKFSSRFQIQGGQDLVCRFFFGAGTPIAFPPTTLTDS
jgi:glycosyltransferase involved in cell wall biosynthesis